MAIYALHGFLGTPADWDGFFPNVHAPNLFRESPHPFWEWAQSFNKKIQGNDNVLVGYSMGGRLALHALIENPSLWKAAIIVSANPGINIENRTIDWHHKFLNDPWDELMDAWNQQPIFCGDVVHRREKDFSREILAEAFKAWDVKNQDNLKEQIEALEIPILWIVGELDQKYVAIAKQMNFSGRSKISIAPQAGHRVPWQNQLWFKNEVKQFL
jgi:2-succinyl-6-hydroxy-2,4-cyclohexadiene-1-carboxylate synthase